MNKYILTKKITPRKVRIGDKLIVTFIDEKNRKHTLATFEIDEPMKVDTIATQKIANDLALEYIIMIGEFCESNS